MSEPTVVRLDRRSNPLDELSEDERMRLIVRVLCELVAYGEPVEAPATRPVDRVAS